MAIGLRAHIGDHVALVGKVESGLDERLRAQQLCAPALIDRTQRSFGLRQGLAGLRRGLGIDEIGKSLDFGQVELAVLEGAARELARLGEPRAGKREYGLDDPAYHRAAAMHMEFGHVLAGEARGTFEPEHEAPIEQPHHRRSDLAQAGVTGRGYAAAQGIEYPARVRSRDADHGDGGEARPARRRNDGVGCGDDLGLHCVILGCGERKGHAGAR